jgi:hypothetical protein
MPLMRPSFKSTEMKYDPEWTGLEEFLRGRWLDRRCSTEPGWPLQMTSDTKSLKIDPRSRRPCNINKSGYTAMGQEVGRVA